jgi:hypothetical protein
MKLAPCRSRVKLTRRMRATIDIDTGESLELLPAVTTGVRSQRETASAVG